MDASTAPSNPLGHGERPPHSSGEGQEDFEKKPVLKKVKDKVKKIKSTIANKARRHGGGNGDDDNQHQHGDLDEEDEGYEEDEEMVEDPSTHGGPVHGSTTDEAGSGAKGLWRVGESEGAFGSSAAGANELGVGGGAAGGYDNSAARSGAGLVGETQGKGIGFKAPEFVGYDNSTARSGAGLGGGRVGETEGKGFGLKEITPEFVEDPAAPNTSTGTKDKMEVDISPEILHSLDAMATSEQSGKTELPEDKNLNDITAIHSKGTGTDDDTISPELHRSFDAMSVSDQTGRGESEAAQNTSSSYTDKISTAKDTAVSVATESAILGKKVASMVYDKASEVGTAVMAKVMPETGKGESKLEEEHFPTPEDERDGRGEVVGKQNKGVWVKEYVSGKLSPGEEDKALSEVITEALTLGKNGEAEVVASQTSSPPKASSGEGGGGGLGVVGKIKETVSSFLGGGGSPRGSPSAEGHTKDGKDFLGKTPEALSEEKTVL